MTAKRDQNHVPTAQAMLNTDGDTLVNIAVNPTTNAVKIDNDTTGSDNGPTNIPRDNNRVPIMFAVSESDGETLVPLYADSSGNLLIDST